MIKTRTKTRTKLKLAATGQMLALAVFISAAAALDSGPCTQYDSPYCVGEEPEETNPGWWDWHVQGWECWIPTGYEVGWWEPGPFWMGSSEDEEEAWFMYDADLWSCAWWAD